MFLKLSIKISSIKLQIATFSGGNGRFEPPIFRSMVSTVILPCRKLFLLLKFTGNEDSDKYLGKTCDSSVTVRLTSVLYYNVKFEDGTF